MTNDDKINQFAIRSFRDMADLDYVAARMSFRAKFDYPALWQSQQAVEKYLKCILLLNRIPAKNVRHSLSAALALVEGSQIGLDLSPASTDFLRRTDEVGECRYFDVSTSLTSRDLVNLDRIVWELRRFCTLNEEARKLSLTSGQIAPKYALNGGMLEDINASRQRAAREALLWNNAFFGKRKRRIITMPYWLRMKNAPLYLHPEILDDLSHLIYVSNEKAWRLHKGPQYGILQSESKTDQTNAATY